MSRNRFVPPQRGHIQQQLPVRQKAFALYAEGKVSEALVVTNKAITKSSRDTSLLNLAAVCHMRLGRPEQAISCWQQALRIEPDLAEVHSNLGVLLQELKRSEEAEEAYRQALRIKPDYAEAHYNIGALLQEQKRSAEAEAAYRQALSSKPDYAEVHYNLGNLLKEQKRYEEAEEAYRQALRSKPDHVEARHNLGNLLKELKRSEEAEAAYRQALRSKPDHAEAYHNLGNLLQEQKRPAEAEEAYRQALRIKPDFVEAHFNLGNLLKELKRSAEAEAAYRQVLRIKPLADAYCNLGILLMELNRRLEAEAAYREALLIEPEHVNVLHNLGLIYIGNGEPFKALDIAQKSLKIKETDLAKQFFCICLSGRQLIEYSCDMADFVVRALSEPWGMPNELALAAISLIKLDAAIAELIVLLPTTSQNQWTEEGMGTSSLMALANQPILRCLMQVVQVSDIKIERLLTAARVALLKEAVAQPVSTNLVEPLFGFFCALAQQCFINEYIFICTEEELGLVQKLRASLLTALQQDLPIPDLWLITVAAYLPLHTLPGAERLMVRSWSDPVIAVLIMQIKEPLEEGCLRVDIPCITAIDNMISIKVQQQYEENPYPRWIKAEPGASSHSVDEFILKRFPQAPYHKLETSEINILIAGCGTGQHPIRTAQTFTRAKVLAIDLSATSLGYAVRKTRELGLDNIAYAQADLLALGQLEQRFDIIESVGVLHHLNSPMAGMRVLVALLRPRGVMKLGFYSELARRHIVAVRAHIAEQGYQSTPEDIRRFRQELFDRDDGDQMKTTLQYASDFFTVSACRDLLFHIQEHRMTLPEISDMLGQCGLNFLGFEVRPAVASRFRSKFPDPSSMNDLTLWQMFEEENPDAFAGMYQFWVQKK